MSSLKEIKTHMESVRETRKITNAMYLIASTKLQKARSELDHTRPYFESMQAEIKRIFRSAAFVILPTLATAKKYSNNLKSKGYASHHA